MEIKSFKLGLTQKIQLTPKIFEYNFLTSETISFRPGQFLNVLVQKPYKRPFSIVEIKENNLKLIADVSGSLPGYGSTYFRELEVGQSTLVYGPMGRYAVKETELPKVFIATGAGIAPFIPMIKTLMKSNLTGSVHLFFGSRFLADDIVAYKFLHEEIASKNIIYTRCITQPEGNYLDFELGRVNEVIKTKSFDWQHTEFYICGNNQMIKNTKEVLINLGADKIYIENYG